MITERDADGQRVAPIVNGLWARPENQLRSGSEYHSTAQEKDIFTT